MNWAAIIWFVLMVVFLIVEAVCLIHLVSIWFAAGSLTAMLLALIGAPVWLQVIAFVLVSSALLAMLWPLVRKHLNPNLTKTNVDAVIGSTGLVTASINNVEAHGQVKLGPMEWTARSTDGSHIPEGTLVRVDRIEGVKAFVTALPVPAEEKTVVSP